MYYLGEWLDDEKEIRDMGFGDSWFYNDGCFDFSGLSFEETSESEETNGEHT